MFHVTKRVKKSEEISCISLQSFKRSFHNIQIFKFAYSALPLYYSLFRLKSSLHRVVYSKRVKESEEISCISLQSFKRSFHKIQIFKFAYSALPLYHSLFRLKSSLHRVVYTKIVKESEEISCLSLQSFKRSLRKIQIFKFAYSALPLCYSLFRLKSSLHRVVYTKRVKESEEISCISLQSFKRSFHKIHIFKFAYSAFPLYYSLFRLKSSLHRVVYTKRDKESEEISCILLQSFKRSFHKIQIFKFAYSALPLYYSLFRLKSSLHRVV